MDHFHYRDGHLYCEDLPVSDLAAQYGTPLYLYSQNAILGQLKALQTAFAELEPLVCYSVKANSNLSILRVMAEHGSGFDVVSGGELFRVGVAGGDAGRRCLPGSARRTRRSPPGSTPGVLMFNVESEAELDAIARVADAQGGAGAGGVPGQPGRRPEDAPVHLDGEQGIEVRDGHRAVAQPGRAGQGPASITMIGVHMHIGSQITTTEPYAGAAGKAVDIIARMRAMGHPIAWFNMGGGFGIGYRGGENKAIAEFARAVVPAIKATDCRLAMEPGRVIAGNSGILVSRVLYTKQSGDKRFLIQDAAMNDLIRPALYESFHRIWPVDVPAGFPAPPSDYEAAIAGTQPWDVVGPVCESGDFLAKDRALPPLDRGALLATFSAGAYGMVMASNYNTRPRAAEILVDGSEVIVARRRETLDDLIAQERAALDREVVGM